MICQGKAKYPVTEIFIHCTATPPDWHPNDTPKQRLEAIRQMHIKDRGWSDIGYHWLIDRDGTVMPGRKETVIGAHVAGHNNGTIGISLFGGLTSQTHDMFSKNYTSAQESSLRNLIEQIKNRADIKMIYGHNQVDSGKACPGFWVPDWLKAEGIKV